MLIIKAWNEITPHSEMPLLLCAKKRDIKHQREAKQMTQWLFSAHLYIFFYNINFIYDTQSTLPSCIRCGYRDSKTQLRMMCSSRNFLFATFWWPMCDKSTAKKIRLSLYAINWIGSHGISHSVNGKSI